METVKQFGGDKHLHPRITFLDFAGHCMNYAFHEIYFSHRTCYILVVDMTKRFDEHVAAVDTNEKDSNRIQLWTYGGKFIFLFKISFKVQNLQILMMHFFIYSRFLQVLDESNSQL